MKITYSIASLAAILCCAQPAFSNPSNELTKILSQGKLVEVKFSDGSAAWEKNTVSVSTDSHERAVIIHAKSLALDTDGASKAVRSCDKTAQEGTALSDKKGRPTDSNSIPYIVLPWCGDAVNTGICKGNPPYKQLHLRKGDLAAVLYGDKIAYAIAADLGPERKFGEGSVELHRRLGHETIGGNKKNPKCAANVSLEGDVYFVIFKNSNSSWLPSDEINKMGELLWHELTNENN